MGQNEFACAVKLLTIISLAKLMVARPLGPAHLVIGLSCERTIGWMVVTKKVSLISSVGPSFTVMKNADREFTASTLPTGHADGVCSKVYPSASGQRNRARALRVKSGMLAAH